MPPKYEELARKNLQGFKTFTVWTYCSSKAELERRESLRKKQGDGREEGMALAGSGLPARLSYDYMLDTNNKNPKTMAITVRKKAMRHWGYNA